MCLLVKVDYCRPLKFTFCYCSNYSRLLSQLIPYLKYSSPLGEKAAKVTVIDVVVRSCGTSVRIDAKPFLPFTNDQYSSRLLHCVRAFCDLLIVAYSIPEHVSTHGRRRGRRLARALLRRVRKRPQRHRYAVNLRSSVVRRRRLLITQKLSNFALRALGRCLRTVTVPIVPRNSFVARPRPLMTAGSEPIDTCVSPGTVLKMTSSPDFVIILK